MRWEGLQVARLPPSFNFGEIDDLTPEELLRIIERMYILLAEEINNKPDLVQRDVDGQATDTFLSQGTLNINTSSLKVEMLTAHPTATTVTWSQLS